jgi:hypothetical protein
MVEGPVIESRNSNQRRLSLSGIWCIWYRPWTRPFAMMVLPRRTIISLQLALRCCQVLAQTAPSTPTNVVLTFDPNDFGSLSNPDAVFSVDQGQTSKMFIWSGATDVISVTSVTLNLINLDGTEPYAIASWLLPQSSGLTGPVGTSSTTAISSSGSSSSSQNVLPQPMSTSYLTTTVGFAARPTVTQSGVSSSSENAPGLPSRHEWPHFAENDVSLSGKLLL